MENETLTQEDWGGAAIDYDDLVNNPIDFKSDTDNVRWMDKPEQTVNAWWFLAIIVSLSMSKWFGFTYWLALIPLIIYLIKRLITHCWWYYYNEKTIQERKGVFSVTTREVHYYRVKSVRLEEPFWMRVLGLSNVVLITSDPYIRTLKIHAVFHGREYMDKIKSYVNVWKKHRQVNEHDIHPMM